MQGSTTVGGHSGARREGDAQLEHVVPAAVLALLHGRSKISPSERGDFRLAKGQRHSRFDTGKRRVT